MLNHTHIDHSTKLNIQPVVNVEASFVGNSLDRAVLKQSVGIQYHFFVVQCLR